MKISIILTLLILCIVCLQSSVAQGGPPATPIDGGLSFLLAAGGAYGIKKLMKVRKVH